MCCFVQQQGIARCRTWKPASASHLLKYMLCTGCAAMALRSTLPYQGPRLNIKPQRRSIVARSALEKVALTAVGAVVGAVVMSVADNHTQQDKKIDELRKVSGCPWVWVGAVGRGEEVRTRTLS